MDKCKITIGNKSYQVSLAKTEEEQMTGLQGVHTLPEDEGVLFVFEEPGEVGFWMKDTLIPLDIIYINDDDEVVAVEQGTPGDETILEHPDIKYVLEVNKDSGVKIGDELEIEDEENSESEIIGMYVIGPKGEIQMEVDGKERIFSIEHTKTIIKLSKKAYKSKLDSDYIKLGKKIFKYIEKQDNQADDFVEIKD